jgi:hypothetical protein
MSASVGIVGTSFVDPWMLGAMLSVHQNAVRVVGFWSPPGEVRGSMNDRFRPLRMASSLDALLAISDSIYVAAPVAQRLGFVQRALMKNKAVFCEPPLCSELADGANLVRNAVNARIAVNYPAPCIPSVALLHGWLKLGALGVPDRLVVSAGNPSSVSSSLAGAIELLMHYLFISRRLFGPLTLRDADIAFPYGLPSWLVPFRAGGIPALLVAGGGNEGGAPEPAWTLLGVGAARIRGWAALERARPDGTWENESPHCSAELLHAEIAGRQISELAALSRGGAHHLATAFEAYEVQAFLELLRDTVTAQRGSREDLKPPLHLLGRRTQTNRELS